MTSSSSTTSIPPIPPPSFLQGLLLGSILYSLFRYLSPILTSRLGTPSFQTNVSKLNSHKLYHYHSLLPSTAHAVVQIVGTWSLVFYGREGLDYYNTTTPQHEHAEDTNSNAASSTAILFDPNTIVTYGLTPLGPTIYMGIFVGYLLTDVLFAPSLQDMEYVFVIHHITASLCWTYCASHRIMQNYAILLQFCELSTVFMNIRQYLLTAGYSSSHGLVMGVSLIFFVTFALVRVCPLPWVIYNWIYRDFGKVKEVVGVGGSWFLTGFVVVHVALQSCWFGIMIGKLWKMVGSSKGGSSKDDEKKTKAKFIEQD